MKRPWFKFFTRDFRDGVCQMSAEQIGVYVMILSVMYEMPDGRLADDDRQVAYLSRIPLRLWRRIKGELLELGKLSVEDGFLVNRRVSDEVNRATIVALKRAYSGSRGGLESGKVRQKANENKGDDEAIASNLLPYTQRHRDTDTKLDKSSLGSARKSAPKKPLKISTDETLPKEPTEAMAAHAAGKGFVNGSLDAEFAKWRDYHLANGTKIADVDASFRTWIAKAVEFRAKAKAPSNNFADRPAIYPNPYRG